MKVRGIRGATTVEKNEGEPILSATEELLREMIRRNQVTPEDIACVFVTMTTDLNAVFPTEAIRSIPGWEMVPLLCANEIPVPGSLPRCIRLLLLINTNRGQKEIEHVYLRGARSLRPDLAKNESLTPDGFSDTVMSKPS
ncbi:chorismate mutase [Polycladomyces sp. WAk]|uniref:chorismate mutase n=1 Tax=Polycladomyces zharkentensis TaxID=2807616 RepID=A0ABS2WJD4_9BACL|nr:chorismate mutase [Polycladomyces sp. WAk]MBN2909667.1 chorismate mutase [Polycladomyces sp. WAk]